METFWENLGNFLCILVTGSSNRITPERLKEKRPSVGNDYVSELNTPTSLKIRKPSGSPERSSQTKPKSQASGSKGKPKGLFDGPSEGPPHKQSQRGSKKFSIFKTRNSQDREDNVVQFTDKTVGKCLSIRRGSKEIESGNFSFNPISHRGGAIEVPLSGKLQSDA